MDQHHDKYLHWLHHTLPNAPNYKPETRVYKNAKGIDTFISLTRSYWDYVDWAEQNTDIDFAHWVVHCDINQVDGYSLSHQLTYWLWTDECGRFREGLPTPHSYPPMGYEGWADEHHEA